VCKNYAIVRHKLTFNELEILLRLLGVIFRAVPIQLFEIFKIYYKRVVEIAAQSAIRTIIGGPKNG
jgi:hypothetical protein